MKAIETEYNGVRFRSRLEARWAVFFDALGIKWEFEPEGYEFTPAWTTTRVKYVPDFWLPQFQCYFEVKPGPANAIEIRKAELLAAGSGWDVYISQSSGFPTIWDPDHQHILRCTPSGLRSRDCCWATIDCCLAPRIVGPHAVHFHDHLPRCFDRPGQPGWGWGQDLAEACEAARSIRFWN